MTPSHLPPAAVNRDPGPRLLASRRHTIVLVAILLGIAALGAAGSRQMPARPDRSHLAQYLVLLAMEWLLFLFTWRGLRRAGTALRDVVGPRWRSVRDAWKVVLAAAAFYAVKLVVLGALQEGMARAGLSRAAEASRTLALMAPRGVIESAVWVVLSISAGFVEEIVFRGYLQRQVAAWTRSAALGIVISAVIFGIAHGYQGPRSMLAVAVYGLLFGLLAHAARTLRPGILAHAFEDLTSGLLGR